MGGASANNSLGYAGGSSISGLGQGGGAFYAVALGDVEDEGNGLSQLGGSGDDMNAGGDGPPTVDEDTGLDMLGISTALPANNPNPSLGNVSISLNGISIGGTTQPSNTASDSNSGAYSANYTVNNSAAASALFNSQITGPFASPSFTSSSAASGSLTSSSSGPSTSWGVSGNGQLGLLSGSLQYNYTTNTATAGLSVNFAAGESFVIGPFLTINGATSGPTIANVSGSVMVWDAPPLVARLNIPFTSTTVLGFDNVPWPTGITLQLGFGFGASATLNVPKASLNLLNGSYNFSTGASTTGGALKPIVQTIANGTSG